MEFSLPALIGISIAAMFFGYFFGLFEGRGQGYKRRQKEEAVDRQAVPAPPTASSSASGDKDLLEVSLDDAGAPRVQIEGRRVDAANTAPGDRRRLIELMVMLRPWVDSDAAAGPSAPRVPVSDSFPASSSDVPGPAPATARVQPISTRSATDVTAQPPLPAPASLSLVAQIDSILQERLAGTPLADRGIRLAEALHGGAIVFVGKTEFDGVDKVPDPEIRAAIRAAISDWEKRISPI